MSVLTFREFVESYWKPKCRFRLSEGWRMQQDEIIGRDIMPLIGEADLRKITPADISTVIEGSRLKGHAPNTTKKIYSIISKIFKDAVEFFEFIDRSPVRSRFHRPDVPKIIRPFMDKDTSFMFLEYVADEPLFGIAAWIQLLTGMRVGELQAIEWDDFDFDRKVVRISKTYNRITRKTQNYTKNRSYREVPLPPKLENYLHKRRGTGLVCRDKRGEMMRHEGYKSFLRRIQREIKVPIRASHGLRHSAAKLYKQFGASDTMVQEFLGHKSIQSTQTYLHRDIDLLMELAKKIA
jgi:integrase